MNVKDVEAIEHAAAIKEYCCEHTSCQNCVFSARNGSCDLENSIAADWELPHIKTYKEDFLEKFPSVKFDALSVCCKYLYPNSKGARDCDKDGACEVCWNNVLIEGGT